jgi:ribosomal protein S18 acetylase RimI-like enzyme
MPTLLAELQIRPFDVADTAAVIALWQRTGLTRPWNNPARDIERKMQVAPELFLVGHAGNTLVATVMGGYEGHRGWANYLAVDVSCQGHGYGRLIMSCLEERLLALGCPKLNLQVRADNTAALKFYEAAGYIRDDNISLGKRLISDEGTI